MKANKRRDSTGYQKYLEMALAGGAEVAKIIPVTNVVTAEWVRMKCQFGCSGYNKRLCCPPLTPAPEETRKMLAEYRRGLIYSYTCNQREYKAKRLRMQKLIVTIERHAFLDGHYKALALMAGPCRLCADCNREGMCRHPEQARPSMEGCGIDVYATARGSGIPLQVVTRTDALPRFINLLLID